MASASPKPCCSHEAWQGVSMSCWFASVRRSSAVSATNAGDAIASSASSMPLARVRIFYMKLNPSELLRDLGDPATWHPPIEFRDSLALCALNSAYSTRGSSSAARRVLDRYRALRPTAAIDSSVDLLAAMDAYGGPARFATGVLANHSKLPGTSRLRTELAARSPSWPREAGASSSPKTVGVV